MRPDEKRKVAKKYGVQSRHLESWMMALVEVRNRCAHYGRIYNMPLNQAPYLFAEHRQYRQTQNKIFPVIIILHRMTSGRSEWNTFLSTLEALMDEYTEANPAFMNFPNNWRDILK